jgi:hypothetical protein
VVCTVPFFAVQRDGTVPSKFRALREPDTNPAINVSPRRSRYRLFEPPGAQTGVPRNYRYFNEPSIEVNLVFSFVPRPFTTAMIASAIPAAINPYSIAVAPDWSAQNLRANVTMRGRCRRSD